MPKRTFTASHIREVIEIFRNAPEVSAEKFSGMEFVASLCRQLETTSDDDIEQAVRKLSARSIGVG